MSHRAITALASGLVLSRWCFSDFGDPSLSALWAAIACAFSAAVLWRERPPIKGIPSLWAALPWTGWTLLSLLWSVAPGASLAQGLTLSASLLLGLVAASGPEPRRLTVAWSLVLGSTIASTAALRQLLVGFPAAREAIAGGEIDASRWTRFLIEEGRPMGTLLAPDLFAGAVGVALLVALGLVLTSTGRLRLVAIAGFVLAMVGFIAARSVGASAALFVGGAALAVGLLVRQPGRWSWLLGGCLGLAIAAGIAAGPRLTNISQRAETRLFNQQTGFRTMTWAPLIGHGHNTFGVMWPEIREGRQKLTRYAHGILGQTASDTGAVGLALLLLFYGVALGQIGRVLLSRSEDTLAMAAAAAALCAMIHGLVDYDLMFSENLLPLFVALGLARPCPRSDSSRGGVVGRAVFVVVALGLAGLSLWRGSTLALAASAFASPDCVARAEGATRAEAWAPPDEHLRRRTALSWLGCPEAGPARFERAIRLSARASQASPRDAILRAEHAFALSIGGNRGEAEAEAEAAVAAWPKVGRVLAYRGLISLQWGEREAARMWLERARRHDLRDPVVLRLAGGLESQGIPSGR